jgi:hypothetical protein
MSESLEIKKAKIDSLVAGFTNSGFKSGDRVGQTELLQFLNRRSSSGRFDPIISEKLFEVLSLDAMSNISVEEFINGFLQFEEEIRKNAELFTIKFAKQEEIYSQLSEECRRYKEEKLNAEGLCENSKVSGEITEIDIKRKLEGIKEIIIKVVFNEKSEELHFKIGDLNSASEMANKTFEFKPTSRKDHFEFIMKGINERNQIFDIGSKIFPLTDVSSQEEYLVQIVVPEIENEEQIAAYIKAKIILYWSDYKYYEKQKKKAESKLKKLTIAKNKAEDYLRKIREIYGDLTRKKPDLIVDFNNEKLMQRKGVKLNVDFNNTKEAEGPGGNYVVEFNNQKEVIKKVIIEQEEHAIEQKQEPVVEIEQPQPQQEQINTQETDVNLTSEEYQKAFGVNEQINLDEYNENNNNAEINFDQYQTTGTEQVEENITGLQSTEMVKETEIRNSITEAVIRRSLNKPLITENTLPVIRQEKVNEVIYDTNVTTLPVIFGGKKVTYLNAEESKNFDFGNLFNQANAQEVQGNDFNFGATTTTTTTTTTQNTQGVQGNDFNFATTTTQNAQGQDFNLQDILGTGFTQTTNVQEYNTTQLRQTQDYNIPIGSTTQDYTTKITETKTQTFTNNIGQAQDFSNIMPEQQDLGFAEYQATNY